MSAADHTGDCSSPWGAEGEAEREGEGAPRTEAHRDAGYELAVDDDIGGP